MSTPPAPAAAILSADWTVQQSIEAIAPLDPDALVFVRRWDGKVYWYVMECASVRDRLLAHHDPEERLGDALDLHETDALPFVDLDVAASVPKAFTGVVVDGGSPFLVDEGQVYAIRGEEAAAEAPEVAPGSVRSAYGRIDAPQQATVGQVIDVVIGLSSQLGAGVAASLIELPAAELQLELTVVAPEFDLADGSAWRHSLHVAPDSLSASASLQLIPRVAGPLQILVNYERDGRVIGFASRFVSVDVPVSGRDEEPGRVQLAPPGSTPDLTITAVRRGTALSFTFHTPHLHLRADLPAEPVAKEMPGDLDELAKALLRAVTNASELQIDDELRGIGAGVANLAPTEMLDALAALGSLGAPPSVLIITDTLEIPWELLLLRRPYDSGIPPFLGTQSALGRWPLATSSPPQPPPASVVRRDMDVLVGRYQSSRWRRLPHAEAEAEELEHAWDATVHDASEKIAVELLKRSPPPAVLHFAGHGQFGGVSGGSLVLGDGTISTHFVRGQDLHPGPLVFLNACETGASPSANPVFAGFPSSFLTAGAAAVVAPMWKVDDVLAKELALGFYRLLDAGVPLGEALRQLRNVGSSTQASGDADPAAPGQSPKPVRSVLAYQLYGDPLALWTRPGGE